MGLNGEYTEMPQAYRSIQIQDPADDELAAIRFILVALENLDDGSKSRVLNYVAERTDTNPWKKLS